MVLCLFCFCTQRKAVCTVRVLRRRVFIPIYKFCYSRQPKTLQSRPHGVLQHVGCCASSKFSYHQIKIYKFSGSIPKIKRGTGGLVLPCRITLWISFSNQGGPVDIIASIFLVGIISIPIFII